MPLGTMAIQPASAAMTSPPSPTAAGALPTHTHRNQGHMAQKVQILLTDDLDGSEAAGTVRFGLDGTDYEIDLSEKNESVLRDALAQYVGSARKVSRSGKPF